MSKLYTHDEALELLPWYVNGTLSDAEHSGVERHVRTCLPCRVAMQEQQHLAALLKQQPTVPLSADGGFEKLLATIDNTQRPQHGMFGMRAPRVARWATVTALAASVAVAAWLVILGTDSIREPQFVTASQPVSDNVEIDVVFAAEVSVADKQALLREIGDVMGDPSDIGRYRVRLTEENRARADEIVARLRSDTRVRFAARALSGEKAP